MMHPWTKKKSSDNTDHKQNKTYKVSFISVPVEIRAASIDDAVAMAEAMREELAAKTRIAVVEQRT